MDDLLQLGIAAFESGKIDEARRLLLAFVDQNPDNESGWGWLFNVCDTDKERVDCLEQVIRINPHNEKAEQLLRKYSLPEQSIPKPIVDEGMRHDFENDVLARKVTRFLVIIQGSALFLGIIFTLIRLSSTALFLAFVSLVVLLGALTWFYIRYGLHPIVQEKRKLTQQTKNLQAQILVQSTNLNLTQQKREKIKQAEQAELSAALQNIQKKHIDSGLSSVHIANADIPGINWELKQLLVSYGFSNALSVTPDVKTIEGFSPARTQAVLDWQARIRSYFEGTKPKNLPTETYNPIKNKFQIQNANNDAEERKIQETKTKLENRNKELQPLLSTLAPLTFGFYLRNALGSKGTVAALTGAGLILSNILLGSSATFGAVKAALATSTFTPTITYTLTRTYTPTFTYPPTTTDTPTITDTQTLTLTSTSMDTPTCTLTPGPTFTPTTTPTLTSTPTVTRTSTQTPMPVRITPGGIYGNPWGYNFKGSSVISNPPSNFCIYFMCANNFWDGKGYVIECGDNTFNKTGGGYGACSGHGGVPRILYSP